ncbi:hypothetical protein PMI12_02380 [Variovorax sp. CF313]|nr:hypothetical protein PMI12_02380 [Variovorax sp. CF313]
MIGVVVQVVGRPELTGQRALLLAELGQLFVALGLHELQSLLVSPQRGEPRCGGRQRLQLFFAGAAQIHDVGVKTTGPPVGLDPLST